MSLLRLLWVTLCLALAAADEYAVFATGAAVWYGLGYSQDATMFHAYQMLKSRGVPTDNMLVMTIDRVARDSHNKEPGILRNVPGGPNVYDHSAIDYAGANYTKTNFLNAIEGNASAVAGIGSGRVLQSTANDNVFIYYMDHGDKGSVVMPPNDLQKEEFQSTLKRMHAKKMFKKLVVYMEACFAGSMGDGLPTDIDVLFVTPDTPNQPTVATHCHDNKEGVCIAALWGLTWIQNAEQQGPTETLEAQFKAVSSSVSSQIHPCMYGDKTIAQEPIGDFMGSVKSNITVKTVVPTDYVTVFDAPLMMLEKELETATPDQREVLTQRIKDTASQQQRIDELFAELQTHIPHGFAERDQCNVGTDLQCYRDMQHAFSNVCGEIAYVRKYANTFSTLCAAGQSSSVVKSVSSRHC